MRIIVVGAGVVGAAIAYNLVRAGAAVTVIEAGQPAGAASGGSFGWINASFYADAPHHRLRAEGIAAHHRLAVDLGIGPDWPGCLWWEAQGDDLLAMAQTLTDLDYPVEVLDRAQVQRHEPHLAHPPEQALAFAAEGAVDPVMLTAALLQGAVARGVQIWTGVPVTGLCAESGRIVGVQTNVGRVEADLVVLATGTASTALLAQIGVHLPMLSRPGLILRTRPVGPLIGHILVSPEGEVRQDAAGRVILPTSLSHQGDSSEAITDRPDLLADAAMDRLRHHLPQLTDPWAEVNLGWRPVPQDGLPVIGPVTEGAYVATMHSGVTLAAIVGELVAREVMGGQGEPMLSPYRVGRFA